MTLTEDGFTSVFEVGKLTATTQELVQGGNTLLIGLELETQADLNVEIVYTYTAQ